MRCVDWNDTSYLLDYWMRNVTPRMRCVDWNVFIYPITIATGGHTSYEVCGLKFLYSCLRNAKHHRHTSYEVCGLKSLLRTAGLSNPPRHTSYEVCGLKYTRRKRGDRVGSSGHTSYEVCGLKFVHGPAFAIPSLVTPRMRCVDWNWIHPVATSLKRKRHTSYEVCGLKFE